ncbi:Eco57I restriction-modification methylase domain-containing protein [Salinibacter sp.]|uniref:Eco57I restriction-modification methylase domain-containing protein n=1 Tax=Salinibacter sp. TaxID=2065818 RepID=UPI0021E8C840|nr:TaqI-like C-terminal specificity domain-containing protein [Salinibacter sp.]
MKGHHPTPQNLAEKMVRRLFEGNLPMEGDRILYPGCGTAPFAVAVENICQENGWPTPSGYGVDISPELLEAAREQSLRHVRFEQRDFLASEMLEEEGPFNYIVGNPPYVPIEGLNKEEKTRYRAEFGTASGRFDLYILFFERALEMLAPSGRITFITPEKWEYVETATPLRTLLRDEEVHVEEIRHIEEDTFEGLITFPSVTTIRRSQPSKTRVVLRDGTTHATMLPASGQSWASSIRGADLRDMETGLTLGDVTTRVSAGMATGADSIFVMKRDEVPSSLEPDWVRPTVSGRQLNEKGSPRTDSVLLCPYRDDGSLVEEQKLGTFGEWAQRHRDRLEDRSCVKKAGKEWYAWHETPPMSDLLQPKIVFKDIEKEPRFWAERKGDIIPRHSVYYLVPDQGVSFDGLLTYLNSPIAQEWMEANCQRAANGFLRLQSRVLRQLPVPKDIVESYQTALAL